MDRTDELQQIFLSSSLAKLFQVRVVDYYGPQKDYTALRFHPNSFRIRALEIWDRPNPADSWLRVYHSDKMAAELKQLINGLPTFRLKGSASYYSDFIGDFQKIAQALGDLLSEDNVLQIVQSNPVVTRNSAYAGLVLPDVDVSDADVLGRIFTWKELIAINEDDSDGNELRKVLTQSGVYLQRSPDGTSRYVGSASGDGGILGRWIRHLTSNGSAKHLNIYVLENGYANVMFTVLEFTENVLEAESRWKETLGSRNIGIYDGFRLNSN